MDRQRRHSEDQLQLSRTLDPEICHGFVDAKMGERTRTQTMNGCRGLIYWRSKDPFLPSLFLKILPDPIREPVIKGTNVGVDLIVRS